MAHFIRRTTSPIKLDSTSSSIKMCHRHYYQWNCFHTDYSYWTHGTGDKCDGIEFTCPNFDIIVIKVFDFDCGKSECAKKAQEARQKLAHLQISEVETRIQRRAQLARWGVAPGGRVVGSCNLFIASALRGDGVA
jgi:hypothetical protein